MLQGNVGFVQVSEFSESTPEQFEAALQELQGQGMKSVIVDLRDNPGGVLQSVCKMLDLFLPEGVLVYTEDKYGNRTDFKSDKTCMEIPMAVLINGNSASASEIFAGAIKDYKYGTLVGTTSFGKGIVQTIVPMDDGSAVKVTMAKYFTPNGNYIHDVGISPDIELEYVLLKCPYTEVSSVAALHASYITDPHICIIYSFQLTICVLRRFLVVNLIAVCTSYL